jgi:exodeoxyribonuclease VII large subunit
VLAGARGSLRPLSVRLTASMQRHLATLRQGFANDVARLSAMSPLRVLARGYAIATDASGRAVRDHREVEPGDAIAVRVHHGALLARVVATAGPGEPLPPADPAAPAGSRGGSQGPRATRGSRRRASSNEQLGLGFLAEEPAAQEPPAAEQRPAGGGGPAASMRPRRSPHVGS